MKKDYTILAMGLLALPFPLLAEQTDIWTKPESGYWEEPFWSLATQPSASHSAILFTNAGYKAVEYCCVRGRTHGRLPQPTGPKRIAHRFNGG
jgi:hypothetical protein